MKVLISIGSTTWLANSALDAAKVADAIGKFTPLERDWNNHNADVFMRSPITRDHSVKIDEVTKRTTVVDDEKAAAALRKECGE